MGYKGFDCISTSPAGCHLADGELRLLGVDSEYKLTRSPDGEGSSKRFFQAKQPQPGMVPKRSIRHDDILSSIRLRVRGGHIRLHTHRQIWGHKTSILRDVERGSQKWLKMGTFVFGDVEGRK